MSKPWTVQEVIKDRRWQRKMAEIAGEVLFPEETCCLELEDLDPLPAARRIINEILPLHRVHDDGLGNPLDGPEYNPVKADG